MNANINANNDANTLIGDNALHGHTSNNKPTRVKKPALPAKANNLLVFSFWLIETLQHNHLLHDKDAAFKFIQLFNDVPSQLSFFNSFFLDFKLSHKLLKNTIKFAGDQGPPARPPLSDPTAEKKKRTYKRKAPPKPNSQENLTDSQLIIQQLVLSANSSPEDQPPAKSDQETQESVAQEGVQSEPLPEKKKRAYVRKVKVPQDSPNVVSTEEAAEV